LGSSALVGVPLAMLPLPADASERGCRVLQALRDRVQDEIDTIDAFVLLAGPADIARWQSAVADAARVIGQSERDASQQWRSNALTAVGIVVGVALIVLGAPIFAGGAAILTAGEVFAAGILAGGVLLVAEATVTGTVNGGVVVRDTALNRLSGVLGVAGDTQPLFGLSTRAATGASNMLAGVGVLLSVANGVMGVQQYNAIVDEKERLAGFLRRAEQEIAAMQDGSVLRAVRLETLTNLRADLDDALAAGCVGVIRG
jgi:hypothetical protein